MHKRNIKKHIFQGAVIYPRGDWMVFGGIDGNDRYLGSSELLDIYTPNDDDEDVAGHWHKGPSLHEGAWKPSLIQVNLYCFNCLIDRK